MFSRLKYSHKFRCTVDPTDLTVWNKDGKKLTFYMTRDYMQTGTRMTQVRLYLHRIIADACVPNPRPDLFHVVDHINGRKTDNRPCNLRWVNPHLNMLNLWPSKGYNNIYESTRNWGGKWLFYKCGMYLQNFMNKDLAILYAKDFNKKHFFRMHALYVNSPEPNTQEWYAYWKKNTISHKDKSETNRRVIILGEKNVVTHKKHTKLTSGYTKTHKPVYETWWEKSERLNLKL